MHGDARRMRRLSHISLQLPIIVLCALDDDLGRCKNAWAGQGVFSPIIPLLGLDFT